MTPMQFRGLLFDMDGVLVDSTAAVARVWSVWASKHGLDPETVVKIAHGRPSISTIRELLPRADHEAEDREVERLEIEDVEGIAALPGAAELLGVLPASRYAIVTSATRPLAEVRLRAAGLIVPANLVTARDVQRGKPNPDPYLMGENPTRPAGGMCSNRGCALGDSRRKGGGSARCGAAHHSRRRGTRTGGPGLDRRELCRTHLEFQIPP